MSLKWFGCKLFPHLVRLRHAYSKFCGKGRHRKPRRVGGIIAGFLHKREHRVGGKKVVISSVKVVTGSSTHSGAHNMNPIRETLDGVEKIVQINLELL